MPPVERMLVAWRHFMLDENGGSVIECVVRVTLTATMCALLVLSIQQYIGRISGQHLQSRLLINPRYSILFALLLAASISDCRSYKIPNWLTFGGSAFALIYSVFSPFSPQRGFGSGHWAVLRWA